MLLQVLFHANQIVSNFRMINEILKKIKLLSVFERAESVSIDVHCAKRNPLVEGKIFLEILLMAKDCGIHLNFLTYS